MRFELTLHSTSSCLLCQSWSIDPCICYKLAPLLRVALSSMPWEGIDLLLIYRGITECLSSLNQYSKHTNKHGNITFYYVGRQGRTRTYGVSDVRDLQSRAFATQLHLTIKIKDVLACVCSLKVISNQTMPLNQFHNYSSIRIQTDHAIYFIMLHCYFIAVFCYV